MAHLKGKQLSLLITVPTYELENPPQPGEMIATRSGKAVVTRIEPVGRETLFWGDYGSGIEQPHGAEELLQLVESPLERSDRSNGDAPQNKPNRPRRHSPKGKASGWIEERIGNKQRRNPTISYYYCWEIDGVRDKCYIPAGKLWRVQQMVEVEGKPIAQVMEVLNGGT